MKIPSVFFAEIGEMILKILMKMQETQNSQDNLKKNTVGRHISLLHNFLQSYSHQQCGTSKKKDL